jgi:hypothetical protein
MAVESRGFNVGFLTAAADLRTAQYKVVAITAAGQVNIQGTKGAIGFGILQNKPNINEAADVMCVGISKLVTGTGNLAAAANYEQDTDGTGVTAEAGKVALGTVILRQRPRNWQLSPSVFRVVQ